MLRLPPKLIKNEPISETLAKAAAMKGRAMAAENNDGQALQTPLPEPGIFVPNFPVQAAAPAMKIPQQPAHKSRSLASPKSMPLEPFPQNPEQGLLQPADAKLKLRAIAAEHAALAQNNGSLFAELGEIQFQAQASMRATGKIPPRVCFEAFKRLKAAIELLVPEQETVERLVSFIDTALWAVSTGQPMPQETVAQAYSTISGLVREMQLKLYLLEQAMPINEGPESLRLYGTGKPQVLRDYCKAIRTIAKRSGSANFAFERGNGRLEGIRFISYEGDIRIPREIPETKTGPTQKSPRKDFATAKFPPPENIAATYPAAPMKNIAPISSPANSESSSAQMATASPFFPYQGRGSSCVVSRSSTSSSSHSSARCTRSKQCLGGHITGGMSTHAMHLRNSIKVLTMEWNWIAWIGVLRQVYMLSRK